MNNKPLEFLKQMIENNEIKNVFIPPNSPHSICLTNGNLDKVLEISQLGSTYSMRHTEYFDDKYLLVKNIKKYFNEDNQDEER